MVAKLITLVPDELFFLYEDFIPPLSYVDELQKITNNDEKAANILILNEDDVTLPSTHIKWDIYGYFGPLNIYHLHRFQEKLTDNAKLFIVLNPEYSSIKLSNTVVLLAFIMMIRFHKSVLEVKQALECIISKCPTFSSVYGKRSFISVENCIHAIQTAKVLKIWNLQKNFSEDWNLYTQMDINWIQDGKIAASCAPGINLENFLRFCNSNKVKGVVRLTYNPNSYDSKLLLENDIDVLELPFIDGGSPSSEMIRIFIDFLDSHSNNAVVVHCRAGFGRTGVLIACYLMKKHKMTADDAVALIRMRRDGAIFASQHHFLKRIEKDLWEMHESEERCPYLPNADPVSMLIDVAPTKELESLTRLARKYPTMSMTAEYMNGFLRDLHKLPKVPSNLQFCASAVQEEDGTFTIPSKDFLCMLENAVVGARWCALDTPAMLLV